MIGLVSQKVKLSHRVRSGAGGRGRFGGVGLGFVSDEAAEEGIEDDDRDADREAAGEESGILWVGGDGDGAGWFGFKGVRRPCGSPAAAGLRGARACQLPRETYLRRMTAEQILQEIRILPEAERGRLVQQMRRLADDEIPQDFIDALEEFETGRFVSMETALNETPPGS